jgi:hypothetical protein
MAMSGTGSYINITLDEHGGIVEVRRGDRVINPETTSSGACNPGSHVPGCGHVEEVKVHELLVGKKPEGARGGSDPNCVRDPGTGRVWCW